MRNMSFALTTQQMLAGTKTVTRRLGWAGLQPGTVLCAVEKSQGLGKGGKVRRLGQIRVLSVTLEPLNVLFGTSYGDAEAVREGFPHLRGEQFAAMFCEHMGCGTHTVVTRIEFEHLGAARETTTHAELARHGVVNHDVGRTCGICQRDVPSGFKHEHGFGVCRPARKAGGGQ